MKYFNTGNAYSISQEIDVAHDLPYGMNRNYINDVKPSGILRSWFQSPIQNSRSGIEQLLTMTMKLTDTASSSSQDVGEENIRIEEGKGTPANVEWNGKEVAFTFSKAENAESKITQTADKIRYTSQFSSIILERGLFIH